MKYKMKKWIEFFVGIIILTFGARLLLLSEIGVGGLDAVAIGLANLFNKKIGIMIIFLSLILIGIGNILDRKVTIGPVPTALVIGECYDLWGRVLFEHIVLPHVQGWMGFVYILGLLIAPAGAAIYICSDISTGAIDYLMLAITKRYQIAMRNSRIMLEALFIVVGYMIGGPIGMGTIGIMLFWGPILQVYYNFMRKWLS